MELNVFMSQNTCEAWLSELERCGIIYVHAMKGYGKSAQSKTFVKKYFANVSTYRACSSDYLCEIEAQIELYKKVNAKNAIIIDKIHKIQDKEEQKKFLQLLSNFSEDDSNTKIILLSNGTLPNYFLNLKLSKKLAVFDKQCLKLGIEEVVSTMRLYSIFAGLSDIELKNHAGHCLNFSDGYATAVTAYLQRLSEHKCNHELAGAFAKNDLNAFFDYNIKYKDAQDEISLLKLSVFQTFTMDMAQKVLCDNCTQFVEYLMQNYGIIETVDGKTYVFEASFYRYLWELLSETQLLEKEKYLEIAADVYEKNRNYKAALRCYSIQKNYEKMIDTVIFLSENADGCEFAAIGDKYLKQIPESYYTNNPRLLGAKTLIAAYCLKKEESIECLDKLKEMANSKNKDAMYAYVRTSVASPIGHSVNLKKTLIPLSEYIIKHGMKFEHIMLTGNMPTILNGGLDFLPLTSLNLIYHGIMKKAAEHVVGFEFIGAYETMVGEFALEKNEMTKALKELAKGLRIANQSGSIRVQYAATGVMSRLFCIDNNIDKASEMLNIFHKKAQDEKYTELLPNIDATLVGLALLKGDAHFYTDWLVKKAPNEFLNFYITLRYELYTKAKVYIALGKYLDALYIIGLLEHYANICDRKYLLIQLNMLKSIIHFRQNEKWEKYFVQALKVASGYTLIRVIADEGNAILPILKKFDYQMYGFAENYMDELIEETQKIAKYYPNYLKTDDTQVKLTKKEKEVLILLAKGLTNVQMAEKLNINLGTIKFHIANIMRKFDVGTRALIINVAHEKGFL